MKDVLKTVGAILALIAISVFVMVWGFGLSLFGLKLAKPLENARTGVTRSTNQYVTTQQQLLLQYAKEYRAAERDGDGVQMAAIQNQIDSVAATLDPQYIPASVQPLVNQ